MGGSKNRDAPTRAPPLIETVAISDRVRPERVLEPNSYPQLALDHCRALHCRALHCLADHCLALH